MIVKTRAAPSPTWFVHLWNLRTLLYDYLFAKKYDWIFLVRVEDTDQGRLVEGSIDALIKTFQKTWIMPDEGPAPFKDMWNWPYYQSQRLDIYKKYIDKLVEDGTAYYCFCTQDRLAQVRKEQEELKLPTKYDEHCRNLPLEESKKRVEDWEAYVIRLKVPKWEKLIFNDLVKWKIEFNTSETDDFVLMKSDWFPTYHWAVVIDDYEMKVTHAFRWEEWLPSMPKQILTARALGIELPEYAHMPNILWMDRKKLSKRTWDVAVENYFRKWYLVDAMINYLAFLGWNPKTTEEIFTLEELIEKFDIKDVHKAWAVFDVEKLNWMNSQYIIKKTPEEIYGLLTEWMSEYENAFLNEVFLKFPKEYNLKIIKELQTRLKKFDEFMELTTFFYWEAKLNHDLLINEKMWLTSLEISKDSLELADEILGNLVSGDPESVKAAFLDAIKTKWLKNGQVLWPVRVALSGEQFSPGAFELIAILWIEKSRERISKLLVSLK
ncbi:MAG: Glutamate-tRNA ligase [uncultured bacterium (gcode 4)]|uniref:Glutamate--tRNA ligase n=1 Tax=uncultured bacterium (gcode 4) TaxID=1234023 RepID=K2FG64_9BACT|nr:MAG: Glutamate-tRNA ligase [uncultured bacterium (gcode 4)]